MSDVKIPFMVRGQECVCPDGLGRVVSWDYLKVGGLSIENVVVSTYIRDRMCRWASSAVILLPLVPGREPIKASDLKSPSELKPKPLNEQEWEDTFGSDFEDASEIY